LSSPASAARKAGLAITVAVVSLIGMPSSALADTGPPTAEIVVQDGILEPVPTPVTINATDDTAIATVDLYAGTRLIGRLTEPPYTFSFQPAVQDIFGQTLIAIVADTAGYQTTVLKRVLITNFKAQRLNARTRYFRSPRAPFRVQTSGRLVRPAALPVQYGCTSGIIVDYSWEGGSTSTRAQLNQRDCSFRTGSIYLPKRGRVSVKVSYLGDHEIAGITRTHRIRIR